MDFTNALLAPQNGTADFTAAGVSITEERLETMDFTIEYAESDQVILVRKGFTDIQSEEDLANVKIGVQQSTTADLYCQEMGFESVSAYKKNLVAAEDLKNGQIDCMILDNMPAEASSPKIRRAGDSRSGAVHGCIRHGGKEGQHGNGGGTERRIAAAD